MFEYLKLETISGLGECPRYKVKIYNDGVVEYEGYAFVYKEGMHKWSVTRKTVNKIDKLINDFGFKKFYLEEELEFMDLPGFRITVKYDDGTMNQIEHNAGAKPVSSVIGADGTDIYNFENKIHKILKL